MTDFRPVGEVLFAFASTDTDLKTGKVLEKTTTRDITLNPLIAPAFFQTLESPPAGVSSPSPLKSQERAIRLYRVQRLPPPPSCC